MLARQQENHDLVRRNTHQIQLRQKLKYGRAIRAKAYSTGKATSSGFFVDIYPKRALPKLMRLAWPTSCSPLAPRWTRLHARHETISPI